jgi:hypothetical protein
MLEALGIGGHNYPPSPVRAFENALASRGYCAHSRRCPVGADAFPVSALPSVEEDELPGP